jgi:hypothetical protein
VRDNSSLFWSFHSIDRQDVIKKWESNSQIAASFESCSNGSGKHWLYGMPGASSGPLEVPVISSEDEEYIIENLPESLAFLGGYLRRSNPGELSKPGFGQWPDVRSDLAHNSEAYGFRVRHRRGDMGCPGSLTEI